MPIVMRPRLFFMMMAALLLVIAFPFGAQSQETADSELVYNSSIGTVVGSSNGVSRTVTTTFFPPQGTSCATGKSEGRNMILAWDGDMQHTPVCLYVPTCVEASRDEDKKGKPVLSFDGEKFLCIEMPESVEGDE